jgi:aminoglycoside/choline kinase family phosphotransferase
MTSRAHHIVDFLEGSGWGKAQRYPLDGDASFRRYERLKHGEKSAILMDAAPPKEDVRPFVNIDGYLRRRGLNAPEIYASDVEKGFLLLEDFGTDLFSTVLSGNSPLSKSYTEKELYIAAIDVLVDLHRATLPTNMPDYDDKLLLKECALFTQWFMPHIECAEFNKEAEEEYLAIWKDLIKLQKITDDVVVLRDYHADNLLWLPEQEGVKRVGLLDFQDAVIGSPIYDLVSLLEDARRDVDLLTVSAVIDYYIDTRKRINREEFMAAYSILAAQRNCKIVGIFARLAIRDKKARYLDYLPRVWKHIEYDIAHPVLQPLKEWLNRMVPKDKRHPSAFKVS